MIKLTDGGVDLAGPSSVEWLLRAQGGGDRDSANKFTAVGVGLLTILEAVPRGPLPVFGRLVELNLSHNKLESLEGLEQCRSLRRLSLCFNKLSSHKELYRLPNPQLLEILKVDGNPLQRQPHYHQRLTTRFPNLRVLNNLSISEKSKQTAGRVGSQFSRILLPLAVVFQDFAGALAKVSQHSKITTKLKSIALQGPTLPGAPYRPPPDEKRLIQIVQELSSRSYGVGSLEALRIIRKALTFIIHHSFEQPSETLETESIWEAADEIISSFSTNFGSLKFPEDDLKREFDRLFRGLLTTYHEASDASLLDFLKAKVVAKSGSGEPISFDLAAFQTSRKYAVECLQIEFLRKSPFKVFIDSQKMPKKSLQGRKVDLSAPSKFQKSKNDPSNDLNPSRNLPMAGNFRFFPGLWDKGLVAHFPVFPFHTEYWRHLARTLFRLLPENIPEPMETQEVPIPVSAPAPLPSKQKRFSGGPMDQIRQPRPIQKASRKEKRIVFRDNLGALHNFLERKMTGMALQKLKRVARWASGLEKIEEIMERSHSGIKAAALHLIRLRSFFIKKKSRGLARFWRSWKSGFSSRQASLAADAQKAASAMQEKKANARKQGAACLERVFGQRQSASLEFGWRKIKRWAALAQPHPFPLSRKSETIRTKISWTDFPEPSNTQPGKSGRPRQPKCEACSTIPLTKGVLGML